MQYVRGDFHGQLPQHFRSFQGTSNTPIYNFNDKNEEEESRYVAFSTCDYLVATLKPQNSESDVEMEENDDQNKKPWSEKINCIYHKIMKNKINLENENENNGGIEVGKLFDFEDLQSPEGLKEKTTFSLFLSKKIIDPSESYSAIARAFFIPGFSGMKNVYNSYSALKKII